MGFDQYKKRVMNMFSKKNFGKFLKDHGFYIVLFICIVAVGVTALWTLAGPEPTPEDAPMPEEPVADEKSAELPEADEMSGYETGEIDTEMNAVSDENIPIVQDISVEEEIETVEVLETAVTKGGDPISFPVISQNMPEGVELYKPVKGRILKSFAKDQLLYCRTLKQWSTHNGLDIEAQAGDEVKAAMAGVVEEIAEDPLMGIVIIINHGEGLKTRYANLSTADMVSLGKEVEAGQVISGIGRTSIASILYPPHLHFEVLFNGVNVDPEKLIK